MFSKLNRKTLGLAACLVLAGGAICATAASAQNTYTGPLGGCWDQTATLCNLHAQEWNYSGYWECYTAEACYACPDSNVNCPAIGWIDPSEVSWHDTHGH
jgi:hypothetical protein